MTDTRERWRRKKKLFGRALELPPEDRAAYLAGACEDGDLVREVEELLAAGEEAGSFLESGPVLDPAMPDDSLLGTAIGPWRLTGLLGRGGMGAVYRARREDAEFDQEVAIKLVRGAVPTHEIGRRFRTERRILASLDHPNIARLLDGGATSDGLPYFVMELVEGLPITRFCDENRWSIRRRLELFRQVCAAVQAAHRNLVVHRDLKPSNILVTANGVPKLLDFGIAKLLDPAIGDVELTSTSMRPMTPEYASPEQISGEPITTASDVYSLGVLLYQLLTGSRPHEVGGRTRRELERSICQIAPERPSTAITRTVRGEDSSTLESVLTARAAGLRELRRRLEGDLDNIVLMALRKEPERRYASADQMAEDVRRHLEGLPVAARGDSSIYRGAKFVGRHRGGVAAAALVLLSLVVGIVLTSHQARVAERERRRAEGVNEVLRKVLSSPDSSWYADGLGPEARIVDVLRSVSADLGDELADAPGVEIDVRTTLGKSFNFLGLLDEATGELDRALELQLAQGGEGQYATADILAFRGIVSYGKADFEAAEVDLRRALEICARVDQCPDRLDATILNQLGAVLIRSGRLAEAEPVLLRGVEAARRSDDVPPQVEGVLLSSVGYSLMERGDLEGARRRFEEANQVLEETAPTAWAERFPVTVNLASVLYFLADFAAAQPWYDRGVEQSAAAFGADHAYHALALLYRGSNSLELGELEQARKDSDQAMAMLEALYPEDHSERLRARVNRAEILCFTGDPEEATEMFERALEGLRRTLPAGDWRIGNAEARFGRCLAHAGRPEDGADLLRRGVADLEQSLAAGDGRLAQARVWLAAAGSAPRAGVLDS